MLLFALLSYLPIGMIHFKSAKAEQPSQQFSDNFSADTGMWEYLGNAYRDIANGYAVITQNVVDQKGVAFFNTAFRTCFTANFSYRAGGGSARGADGFVMFFYKQKYSSFWHGGHLAFSDQGLPEPNPPIIYPGYGIEFDNYYNSNHNDPSENHIALIRNHINNHIVYVNDIRTEDNSWHDVSVTVEHSSVEVLIDQNSVFQWNGTIDRTFDNIGFCGATGADNNWHIIDNFSIEIHSPIEVPTDFPTIQEAINNANDGDTIFVRNGMYYEHVVVNKTVSLIGEDNTVLNGTTVEPMMIVEADDVKIIGFTFVGWAFQNIVLNSTNGVMVTENRIVFNAVGIDVENSVNTTIEHNIIEGFGLDNIGIMLSHSSQCKIVSNTITNAVYFGIRLWFSNSNLIKKNLIKGNDCGIDFYESELNTISESILLDSGGPGVFIDSSSNNYFFHDSFIGNYNHVLIFDSSVNTWDNGVEGNYWSNYTGTDSDGDGIGEEPHFIKGSNQDNYPLISPYMPGDINHDAIVDIFDVARIAGIFGCSSADPQYNPHCDVNEDGFIDIFDLVAVAVNFGKEWTPP